MARTTNNIFFSSQDEDGDLSEDEDAGSSHDGNCKLPTLSRHVVKTCKYQLLLS